MKSLSLMQQVLGNKTGERLFAYIHGFEHVQEPNARQYFTVGGHSTR